LFTIFVSGFPPDFYLGAVEVTIKGVLCRHLVFATPLQLRHLFNVKLWMGGGTFDIITLTLNTANSNPFTQLWSVHGTIVGEGGASKSVPLLHVAMTRRKEADYVAIFEFVKSKFHAHGIINSLPQTTRKCCGRQLQESSQELNIGAAHTTTSKRK
jgi:hypothetical protein